MEALKKFETLSDSDKIVFLQLLGSYVPNRSAPNEDSSSGSQKPDINILIEHFKTVKDGQTHDAENVQSTEPKQKQKTLDSWLIKKNVTTSRLEHPAQNPNIKARTTAKQNDNTESANSSRDFFAGAQRNEKNEDSINCNDESVKELAKVDRLSTSPKTGEVDILTDDKSYNLRSNRKLKLTTADSDDMVTSKSHTDNIKSIKVSEIKEDVIKSGNEFTRLSPDLQSSTVNLNKSDLHEMDNFQIEQSTGSNSLSITNMTEPSDKRRIRKKSFKVLENESNVSDRNNRKESGKKVHFIKPSIVCDNIPKNNDKYSDSETVQLSTSRTKRGLKKLEKENSSSNISDDGNVEKTVHLVKPSAIFDNISKVSENCSDSKTSPSSVNRTKKRNLKKLENESTISSSFESDDSNLKENKNCSDSDVVQSSVSRTKKKNLKESRNENISSSISDEANASGRTKSRKKVHFVKTSVGSDVSKDNINCADSETGQSIINRTKKRSLKKSENENTESPSVVSDDSGLKDNEKCTDSKIVESSVSTIKNINLKENETNTSSSILDEAYKSSDQIHHTKSKQKVHLVKSSVVSKANACNQFNLTESENGIHLVKGPVASFDNIPKNKENCTNSEANHSFENTVVSTSPKKFSPSIIKVSPRKSKRISLKKLQNETEVNNANISSISDQNAETEQVESTASLKNVHLSTTIESVDTTNDKYYSENNTAVTNVEKEVLKEKCFVNTEDLNEACQSSQALSVGFSNENIIQLHHSNVKNGPKTNQSAPDIEINSCNDVSFSNMSKMYDLQIKNLEIENSNLNTSKSLDQVNCRDPEDDSYFLTHSTSEFNYDAFCKVKIALSEVGLDIHDILQNENVQNLLSDYENNPCDDAVIFVGTHKSIDGKHHPVIHTHVSKTKLIEHLYESQKMHSKEK